MVLEPVHCPKCDTIDVVKNGKSSAGKQRYLCRNQECCCRTFIQRDTYRGYLPEVKQLLTEITINSSGMREMARVLKISRNTVTAVLKKLPQLPQVNEQFLQGANLAQISVSLGLVEAAEMDEKWSFVQSQQQPRWLWHAIDHATGKVLAYVLALHNVKCKQS